MEHNIGGDLMGDAGYKVTLKDVHAEVISLRDIELKKIWDSQNDICRKLDKYNGLHKKIDEVVAKVEMQERRCSETLLAQSTEADVLKRINMAKERLFFKVVKLVAVIFAGLGFFLALAGRYWF